MEKPFVNENTKERERLRTLVNRLTDEELKLPISAGWTVGVALAHLAFWDQRSAITVRKWKKSGVTALPQVDTDTLNDAMLPLFLAIPPREAAKLAVSSAEAIDRELEESSAELIKDIEGLGSPSRLYRSIHRKAHLDEIESFLSGSHGAI